MSIGDTVLVTGGACRVGGFALQLPARAEARVITTRPPVTPSTEADVFAQHIDAARNLAWPVS